MAAHGVSQLVSPVPDAATSVEKPGCVVLGNLLLVAWAAVLFGCCVTQWYDEWLAGPHRRMSTWWLLSVPAALCGVALFVAYRSPAVRAIRGLRPVVGAGLVMVWSIPAAVAVCMLL